MIVHIRDPTQTGTSPSGLLAAIHDLIRVGTRHHDLVLVGDTNRLVNPEPVPEGLLEHQEVTIPDVSWPRRWSRR